MKQPDEISEREAAFWARRAAASDRDTPWGDPSEPAYGQRLVRGFMFTLLGEALRGAETLDQRRHVMDMLEDFEVNGERSAVMRALAGDFDLVHLAREAQ